MSHCVLKIRVVIHIKPVVVEAKPKSAPKSKKPPNWNLKTNDKIAFVREDPFFDAPDVTAVPYVSSVVHSRLLFAAVNNGDNYQLRELCNDLDHVHSLSESRSTVDATTPLEHAVKTENAAAVKHLIRELQSLKYSKRQADAVKKPKCLIEKAGTGTYNYHTLSIR